MSSFVKLSVIVVIESLLIISSSGVYAMKDDEPSYQVPSPWKVLVTNNNKDKLSDNESNSVTQVRRKDFTSHKDQLKVSDVPFTNQFPWRTNVSNNHNPKLLGNNTSKENFDKIKGSFFIIDFNEDELFFKINNTKHKVKYGYNEGELDPTVFERVLRVMKSTGEIMLVDDGDTTAVLMYALANGYLPYKGYNPIENVNPTISKTQDAHSEDEQSDENYCCKCF